MSKDEEYLRDFMAMFAMLGLMEEALMEDALSPDVVAVNAYEMADAMMAARSITPDKEGIAAIKPRKKYERKA